MIFHVPDTVGIVSTVNTTVILAEERVQLLKGLAQKPDIYERLARAIAPSIYENEDVKKGILLQLFGGTRKDFSKTGRGNFRAELNILLCGDPGTSKSQLLTYIHNLVPRWVDVFWNVVTVSLNNVSFTNRYK